MFRQIFELRTSRTTDYSYHHWIIRTIRVVYVCEHLLQLS